MTNNDDDPVPFMSMNHHYPGHQAEVCVCQDKAGVVIHGRAGIGTTQAITGYLQTPQVASTSAGTSASYIQVMPHNRKARSHLSTYIATIMNQLEGFPYRRQEDGCGDS